MPLPAYVTEDWVIRQASDVRALRAAGEIDAADADVARFIRAQVELDRLPPDDPRRPGLEKEEARLWKAYRRAWLGVVPREMHRTRLTFRRGFLEELDEAPGTLVRHADVFF